MATANKSTASIRFKTRLLRPAKPANASWTFLVLPKAASEKLPTRSMTTVDGSFDGAPFVATLEPDGQGSHWLKVDRKLREAAGAKVGDQVELEIAPVEQEAEPKVPADLRKALAGAPEARAVWKDITAVARRDWIHWITSPKKPETRVRRIEVACDKLANGQRRACCFDRSGMYSNSLAAPEAAD
ncbi:MAG: YdeI/OmpD-associated family protein [Lysobacter sp.]